MRLLQWFPGKIRDFLSRHSPDMPRGRLSSSLLAEYFNEIN